MEKWVVESNLEDFFDSLLKDPIVQNKIRKYIHDNCGTGKWYKNKLGKQEVQYGETLSYVLKCYRKTLIINKTVSFNKADGIDTWYPGKPTCTFAFKHTGLIDDNYENNIYSFMRGTWKQKDTPKFVSALLYEWIEGYCNDPRISKRFYSEESTPDYHRLLDKIKPQIIYWKNLNTFAEIENDKKALCQYLFGEKVLDDPKAAISDWEDVSEDIKKLFKIKKERNANIRKKEIPSIYDLSMGILQKIKKQPLYRYMLENDPHDHQLTVETMLKNTLHLRSVQDISFDPPVKALLRFMERQIQEYCKEKSYSSLDVMLLLGYIGDYIQQKAKGKKSDSKRYEVLYSEINCLVTDRECKINIPEISQETIKTIISDGFADIPFMGCSEESLWFKLRAYRLIAAGVYYAHICIADSTPNKDTKRIIYKLLSAYLPLKEGEDKEGYLAKDDYLAIRDRFDVYTIVGIAVALSLQGTLLNDYLMQLCKIANNYSVKVRRKQIASILILSYLLVECADRISTHVMKEVFHFAYSRTCYSVQADILQDALLVSSKMYGEIIDKAIKQATQIEEVEVQEKRNGKLKYAYKAKGSPFYLLLLGAINGEHYEGKGQSREYNLLLDAAYFQYITWHNIEDKDKVSGILGKIVNEITDYKTIHAVKSFFSIRGDKEKALIASLAVSLAGFGMANIINIGTNDIVNDLVKKLSENGKKRRKEKCQKVYINSSKKEEDWNRRRVLERVLEVVIWSDMCLRESNPKYMDDLENKNDSAKESAFLLCGAFRFTRALSFVNDLDTKIYIEDNNGDLDDLFIKYLDYEMSHRNVRYAWLIAQLVKFTPCTLTTARSMNLTVLGKKIQDIESKANIKYFLPYDNFK